MRHLRRSSIWSSDLGKSSIVAPLPQHEPKIGPAREARVVLARRESAPPCLAVQAAQLRATARGRDGFLIAKGPLVLGVYGGVAHVGLYGILTLGIVHGRRGV